MNLFEYQGKKLFESCGIKIPESILVSSAEQLPEFKKEVVVKSQILTGGRGKAGAIKFCKTQEEAAQAVGYFLTTPVRGHLAKKVLIEENIDIMHEYYFSISVDRQNKCFSMMFSDSGGVEIENNSPDRISAVEVNPIIGLKKYSLENLLSKYHIECEEEICATIKKLFNLFCEKKMMLLEINPLVITGDQRVVALDAKVILDDWFVGEDVKNEEQHSTAKTEMEKTMASVGASAVQLNGDIAVYAAGAGASMALADSIIRNGGSVCTIIDRALMPSDSECPEINRKIAHVFQSILRLDPKVIVANFFYQAGRCDCECRTLKLAFEEASKRIPVLVRCQGRFAEEGINLFKGTQIKAISSYEQLCGEAVRLARGE